MFKRVLRFGSLAVPLIAALTIAQPALAYTEIGTTGTVGAHSLTDTATNPAAVCVYEYSASNGWMLHHVGVKPPNMKAVHGQGNEKVAWHFTVQRKDYVDSSSGPWKNKYTSSNFVAHTDSTHNASFSQKGVDVSVPFLPGGHESSIYRVLVKLIWYRANGTVLGTATERPHYYDTHEDPNRNTEVDHCGDYFQ